MQIIKNFAIELFHTKKSSQRLIYFGKHQEVVSARESEESTINKGSELVDKKRPLEKRLQDLEAQFNEATREFKKSEEERARVEDLASLNGEYEELLNDRELNVLNKERELSDLKAQIETTKEDLDQLSAEIDQAYFEYQQAEASRIRAETEQGMRREQAIAQAREAGRQRSIEESKLPSDKGVLKTAKEFWFNRGEPGYEFLASKGQLVADFWGPGKEWRAANEVGAEVIDGLAKRYEEKLKGRTGEFKEASRKVVENEGGRESGENSEFKGMVRVNALRVRTAPNTEAKVLEVKQKGDSIKFETAFGQTGADGRVWMKLKGKDQWIAVTDTKGNYNVNFS